MHSNGWLELDRCFWKSILIFHRIVTWGATPSKRWRLSHSGSKGGCYHYRSRISVLPDLWHWHIFQKKALLARTAATANPIRCPKRKGFMLIFDLIKWAFHCEIIYTSKREIYFSQLTRFFPRQRWHSRSRSLARRARGEDDTHFVCKMIVGGFSAFPFDFSGPFISIAANNGSSLKSRLTLEIGFKDFDLVIYLNLTTIIKLLFCIRNWG